VFGGSVNSIRLIVIGRRSRPPNPRGEVLGRGPEPLLYHFALRRQDAEVTYPEEGHGVRKLPAAIDYAARVVAWFEEHMAAEEHAC
jgi:hypothetical protein